MENKTDALEHKKQRGIQTLKERASQRQKIRDVRYYEAIDRLEKLHTPDEVFCHRKCYPEFTHQKQIKTFEARAEGKKADVESPKQEHGVTCSDSMAPSTSKYSSKKSVKPVDWNLCIFCETSNKDKLFNISTFSVSNKILQDSKLENTMRLRLAGVNELIAAEGKYHNKCLNAFKYDTQKTKKECETINLAMIFLVQELGYAASKNQNTPTV